MHNLIANESLGASISDGNSPNWEESFCAWCRKTMDQAGPLVESEQPSVFICYNCARLCSYIIEEESKRRGLPIPEWNGDLPASN